MGGQGLRRPLQGYCRGGARGSSASPLPGTLDLADPVHPQEPAALVTKAVHWQVTVDRGLVDVASGTSGVGIVDVTEPRHPRLVERQTLDGIAARAAARDGLLYVADFEGATRAIDFQDRLAARTLDRLPNRALSRALALAWPHVYLATGTDGRHVRELHAPTEVTACQPDYSLPRGRAAAQTAPSAPYSRVYSCTKSAQRFSTSSHGSMAGS